jgi:hypothetical protein
MARCGRLGAAGGGRRPRRVCPVGQRLREGEEVGEPRDRLSGLEGWLGRRGKIKRKGGWLVGWVKEREGGRGRDGGEELEGGFQTSLKI